MTLEKIYIFMLLVKLVQVVSGVFRLIYSVPGIFSLIHSMPEIFTNLDCRLFICWVIWCPDSATTGDPCIFHFQKIKNCHCTYGLIFFFNELLGTIHQ